MDPIHPIVPQAPNIPPVSLPPAIQRVREEAQQRRDAQERERRRHERERERDDPYADAGWDGDDGRDGEDGRPHVDVTV